MDESKLTYDLDYSRIGIPICGISKVQEMLFGLEIKDLVEL